MSIRFVESEFRLTFDGKKYVLSDDIGTPHGFEDKEDAVRFKKKTQKITGQIIPWMRLPIKSNTVNESWQDEKHKNPSGGMKKSGVDAYRRENPGSKLQTAVTTDPSKLKKDSKPAKRRKSFCARSKDWIPDGGCGNKETRGCKARRKWNC